MSEQVTIQTPDGRCEAWLFGAKGRSARPGIVFYMDGLAIRPALFGMARRLADLGYVVLLPDLFWRDAPYAPFTPKQTFGDPVERARLMALVGGLTAERMRQDVAAVVGWMISSDRIAAGPIGTLGYCMGGRAAMMSAASSPRVRAVAVIHGAEIATEAPDSPHQALLAARPAAYFGMAGVDEYFTSAEASRLAVALRNGEVDHVLENYPGVAHGFAIGDARHYDQLGAERHWRRLESFFAENLSA